MNIKRHEINKNKGINEMINNKKKIKQSKDQSKWKTVVKMNVNF